ncbi:MAG: hypothetical protein QNJ53_24435 [Pleurocapsa sp. MO_192.B19]|nr:hypothetical protein [Pleurocapsa sp. MO_192.B19]
MESPSIYRVDNPTEKRTRVLNSPYFAAVKDAAFVIASQGFIYDDDERLVKRAIALTDLMIEKVGEKL